MKYFNVWTREKSTKEDKHETVIALRKQDAIEWGKKAAEQRGEHFIEVWEVQVIQKTD